MSNQNDVVERYFAVWNEADAGRRRDLIARTWAEDGSYLDPLMQGQGHEGIDALVQGAQAQFPGLRFRQSQATDAHNNVVRFSWELGPEDGAAVAGGTDFATLAADGRLQTVTGFLDFAPGMGA